MLYENRATTIPYILSEAARDAYEKIKALILRIFSLLKKQEKEKDLKEKFYDFYIDLQGNWIKKVIMKNPIVIWPFVQCIIN